MYTSYRSSKTEVRKSFIHGKGLFSIRPIKKDEVIVIRSGHIIGTETLHKYKNIIRDSELQILDDFYLAPLSHAEFSAVMTFVNHSCEPNLGLLGNVVFVAMKDIKRNTELTLDYAMFSTHNDYVFACKCKSENCRKEIRGNDWQKLNLQRHYKNYFSTYIQKKVDALRI